MQKLGREKDAIWRGEAATFDALYAACAPRVQSYLFLLTGEWTAAEDLMQETFLAAYAARHTYQGKSQPLAWLLGIARRRWRDKERVVRPKHVLLSEEIEETSDVAEQVVRAAHLECSLLKLEIIAREAVLLVLGQGLTYAEAADVLNEPVGTVKWRVHTATRTLRQLLSHHDEEMP